MAKETYNYTFKMRNQLQFLDCWPENVLKTTEYNKRGIPVGGRYKITFTKATVIIQAHSLLIMNKLVSEISNFFYHGDMEYLFNNKRVKVTYKPEETA